MNQDKIRQFTKNVSYSFTANMFSMFAGFLSVLIIPKIIGVEEFGYYQLYLFYGSYTILTALGWADGAYLNLGGREYQSLDRSEQSSQYWILVISQTVLYMFLLTGFAFSSDKNMRYVLILTCIAGVVINARYYLNLLLQATNRIKEYSIIVITERLISVLISTGIVLAGYRGYALVIIFDIIGRAISLAFALWYCRDIILTKPSLHNSLSLTRQYMSSGWMLLFSTLSGSLLIGITRFMIEAQWDIITFSKISLTISITNMAVRCINTVSIVFFPFLRQINKERLTDIYKWVSFGLTTFIFGLMILYYPCAKLLTLWLPQYADSIKYVAILLPVCFYESKTSLLINTYFKTLRKEKMLFLTTIVTLACSAILSFIAIYIMNDIFLAVIAMLLTLIIRCIIGELIISRHFKINVTNEVVTENALCLAFILCNGWFGALGMVLYIIIFMIYLILFRKKLKEICTLINVRV